MNPTKKQFEAYQKIYRYYNRKLFNNQLSNCILNFSRKSRVAAGHFSYRRWTDKDGTFTHEININPKYLLKASKMDLHATIVHEMCHLWQFDFGKKSKNGWHNKSWGRKMKEVGLYPSDTGKVGGKEVGYRMHHYIIKDGNFEKTFNSMPDNIELPFKSYEVKPNNKSKIKYSCLECFVNVWGKPDLKIVCGECGQRMNP